MLLTPFAKASQAVAGSEPDDLRNFYDGFVNLIPKSQVWSDVLNFIGHELFTIFIAQLILEKRWSHLNDLLSEPLGYDKDGHRMPIKFTRLSKGMQSLEDLKKHRLAPRYDIIAELHSKGELGELVSLSDIQAADFLLYLREPYQSSTYSGWRPYSCAFLQEAPDFLERARSLRKAKEILPAVGVRSLDELRVRVGDGFKSLTQLFQKCFEDIDPLHIFDHELLGTRT